MREQCSGHRVRPGRQHRVPDHLHPPHRWLRVRRVRRGVPEGAGEAGRQGPRPAHPAGRGRARAAVGGGQRDLRRQRTRRGRRRVHRRRRGQDQERGVRLHPTRGADRRRVDGRRGDRRRRGRGVPGRRRRRAPHRRRGPAGLPAAVGRREPDRGRSDVPHLPVAHPDHRRAEDPQGRAGAEGVGAAPAADHRGHRPGLRQGGHAAAALRDVRLRGHARLPGPWK